MKFPGQLTGEVSDVPASSIDILPTVLTSVGAEIPESVTGYALQEYDPDVDRDDILFHSDGERLIDRTFVASQIQQSVMRRDKYFYGHGGEWSDVYRFGSFPHLIGVETSNSLEVDQDFQVIAPKILDVSTQVPGERSSDHRAVWPLRVEGMLVRNSVASELGGEASPTVAVALGGKVVSTIGAVSRNDVVSSFSVMINPSYFQNGINELRYFTIKKDTLGKLDLQHIPWSEHSNLMDL